MAQTTLCELFLRLLYHCEFVASTLLITQHACTEIHFQQVRILVVLLLEQEHWIDGRSWYFGEAGRCLACVRHAS